MGEMIQKPDTNPVIMAAANFIGIGGLGYFLMGQQKKAIISVVIVLVGSAFCGIGYIFAIVTAYDAYLLGQKLQRGEAIGMNENGLDALNSIFKD